MAGDVQFFWKWHKIQSLLYFEKYGCRLKLICEQATSQCKAPWQWLTSGLFEGAEQWLLIYSNPHYSMLHISLDLAWSRTSYLPRRQNLCLRLSSCLLWVHTQDSVTPIPEKLTWLSMGMLVCPQDTVICLSRFKASLLCCIGTSASKCKTLDNSACDS